MTNLKEDEFKCENCGYKNTYVTKNYKVCRRCGYREALKQEEEDGN